MKKNLDNNTLDKHTVQKKEIMTEEYRKYLRWVCSQDFIIPTGEKTYFNEIDMQLSRHYNDGDYYRFMGAIREAKAAFSQA